MTNPRDNLPHILEEHRKWRLGDGGARANLARANLAGANLADADLAGANLARANLAGANLADANLAGANLASATLASANLADADLAGANLARAYLADADLAGANLADANLADANLASQHIIDGGQRIDGYRFVGWIKGADMMIRAGCRNLTLAEYRAHNAKREDVAMRDETSSILDHIERVARVRGLI
jgi:uncharacterized protein YjbI with pentapeptide repeats